MSCIWHCWVPMNDVGFFMEGEQMDFDFMESCIKPLALVFKPFYTEFHAYDDLHDLLESLSIRSDNMFMMIPPEPIGAITHICIFVGENSKSSLDNLAGFVRYNDLRHSTGASVVWGVQTAVAVGYNDVSRTVHDIPMSTFPWIMGYFCYEDNPGIFQSPFSEVLVASHKTATACMRCTRYKVPCIALPGLRCTRCEWAESTCEPSPGESNARIRHTFDSLVEVAYALGAPFRMLINMVKLRHGYEGAPRMNHYDHSMLKAVIDRDYPPTWNQHAQNLILINCGSFQVVRFRNGSMKIEGEQCMHIVHGFVDSTNARLKKIRAASVVPHLGLERAELAFSLIDNAMNRPGQIFYLTANIMSKHWTISRGRIFLVCGYNGPDDVLFVIGWQF